MATYIEKNVATSYILYAVATNMEHYSVVTVTKENKCLTVLCYMNNLSYEPFHRGGL